MSEVINTAPLEQGDDIGMQTAVQVEGAYADGRAGDILCIVVPEGRGLVLEAWLRRRFFGGTEETS